MFLFFIEVKFLGCYQRTAHWGVASEPYVVIFVHFIRILAGDQFITQYPRLNNYEKFHSDACYFSATRCYDCRV